jgi:O-antigen ligase
MLRSLAGWILLATLVAAPWALASIDDWAKGALGAAGLLAALPWAAHYIRTRKRPPIPPLCAAVVAALLALGWAMTLNARSAYQFSTHKYMSLHPLWDAAPGAVERFTAAEWLWPITGIFAFLLIACDLSADPPWRRRIWTTMTATGLSIAAYGILEKMEFFPPLTTHYAHEASVFGPFDYHGNAGAFLNVILSLLIAVVWHLITTKNPSPAPKTPLLAQNTPLLLALAATLLLLLALFVNISRGAVLIMAFQLLLFVGWAFWRRSRQVERRRGRGGAIALAAAAALLIVTVAAYVLYADPRRAGLGEYLARGANSGRVLAWRVAWGISTDAPWFGSGPGSFKLLFSHTPHWIFALYSRWVITTHIPGNRVSEWSYACQDYLQLLVEWGWVGLALWALLTAGALVSALRALRRAPPDRQWLLAAILIALTGIFAHALFDYPLQIPSLQLYVGVLTGMAWGARRWNPQTSPSLSPKDPLRTKPASRILF